jgi:hypothetical protein
MSLTSGISLSPRNKSPYNPLPDERDPPTSINLPTVSASGTISYSRSSSSNSSPVTGKGFVDASLQGDLSHRAEQQDEREEETHLDQNNNKYLSPHPRERYSAAAKGKGRQRDTRWDLDTMEMAQTPVIQEHEEVYNEPRWNAGMRDVEMGAGGYGAGLSEAAGDGWGGRSEEEAEEKRIQDVSPRIHFREEQNTNTLYYPCRTWHLSQQKKQPGVERLEPPKHSLRSPPESLSTPSILHLPLLPPLLCQGLTFHPLLLELGS